MQTLSKPFTGIVACVLFGLVICSGVSAQTDRLPDPKPTVQGPGALVVLSGAGSEALLLDPRNNRVLARFPTGPGPQDVALSPDGRFAYVTSFGWEPQAGARPPLEGGSASGLAVPLSARGVTVLDLVQRRVHAVFQPAPYRNLGGIVVGEGGDRLWVTSQSEHGVVELDAHTGEVKMLWRTSGATVDAVAVSHDARRVFVSSSGSDEVNIFDRVTVVPTRVATGRRPTGLAVTPDGRELWVANSGEHTISVIKGIRRPREIERFPSGGTEPVRISFHAGRQEAWVSNRGSRTVTVLDIASAALIAEISLPTEPHAVTFSNDGRHAYVSSPAGHRVFVIDVESRELIESLDAGSRPGGLVWSTHGNP